MSAAVFAIMYWSMGSSASHEVTASVAASKSSRFANKKRNVLRKRRYASETCFKMPSEMLTSCE